jgi:hypothetical protein
MTTWKALRNSFALSCFLLAGNGFAEGAVGLNATPPFGAILYQPYVGSRIYSAILEATVLGGRRGLSFFGVGSFSETSGPSTFAVTAALPFTKIENSRTSGWAFGAGYGRTTFSYEVDRYLAPPLEFYEIMFGRTSTEGTQSSKSDSILRTGFGGYFEATLRDEQPIKDAEYESIMTFYSQSFPQHNRSLNFRFGAVSGLGGIGYVSQKPSTQVGYSYHLGISMPFFNTQVDNQATLFHFQNKVFFYCQKPNWVCGTDINVHYARDRSQSSAFEDLKIQFFYGAWSQWYFLDRYLLSAAVVWVFSMNNQQRLSSNIPLLKSSFSIAF